MIDLEILERRSVALLRRSAICGQPLHLDTRMELSILRNRELRVSVEELSNLLDSNSTSTEDLLKTLNLANKKLIRWLHLQTFSNYLSSLHPHICNAVNPRKPYFTDPGMQRLLSEKPKSSSVQREVAISQQLIVENLRALSQKRFSASNPAHLAIMKTLCDLFDAPPSDTANAPSPYLKILKEVPAGATLSLFQSPLRWLSASELSLHLMSHLGTHYADLYRVLIHEFSTSPHHTVPLPVVAHMVGNTVLDVFSTPSVLLSSSNASIGSPGGGSGSPLISANSTNALSASLPPHSLGSTVSSAGFIGVPISSSPSSGGTSPSALASSLGGLPNGTGTGGSSPHRTLWERDPTKPFDTRLPEVVPLLFDSLLSLEEVFCISMYIIHFLTCDNKMHITMLRMPTLLTKVQSRLKKLLAKATKIADLKLYASKVVKPTTGELYEDTAAHKTALIQKVISQQASDEDASESLSILTDLLNQEEALHHSYHNSRDHFSSSSRSASTSPPRPHLTTAPTNSKSSRSPDQSPARSKASRRNISAEHGSPGSKRKVSSSSSTSSSSATNTATSNTPTITGWAWVKTYIPQLLSSLASASKYDNLSFLVPHIVESRLYVNSLLKFIATFLRKMPSGIAEVDSAVRALNRQNLSPQGPYTNFIEYLRLNNSVASIDTLEIVVAAIKYRKSIAATKSSSSDSISTHGAHGHRSRHERDGHTSAISLTASSGQAGNNIVPQLLEADLLASISPHLETLTQYQLQLAIDLQAALVDRIIDLHSFQLDATKAEHAKYFSTFWQTFFGESGKPLTSSISKQWYLLGIREEDPTRVIKTRLPIHFLTYINEQSPERLDQVLLERLLLRPSDYSFALVFIEISEMVLNVVQACIGLSKFLPSILTHPYFFEEICQECIFLFDDLWMSKALTNTPENVTSCIKHIKRVLFLALQTEKAIKVITMKLQHSVSTFGLEDGSDLPPTMPPTYLGMLDAKHNDFLEQQAEMTKLEAVKREPNKSKRKSSKRRSGREHLTITGSKSKHASAPRRSHTYTTSSASLGDSIADST